MAVSSKSHPKITAAKLACPKDSVRSFPAQSLVSDNPVGATETERGACNRLKAIVRACPKADYWIAIESGLQCLARRWYDVACVIIRNRAGKTVRVWSVGTQVPTYLIHIARKRGFKTTTAGKIYCETHPGADHQDLQSIFSQGRLKRERVIADAILAAMAQF